MFKRRLCVNKRIVFFALHAFGSLCHSKENKVHIRICAILNRFVGYILSSSCHLVSYNHHYFFAFVLCITLNQRSDQVFGSANHEHSVVSFKAEASFDRKFVVELLEILIIDCHLAVLNFLGLNIAVVTDLRKVLADVDAILYIFQDSKVLVEKSPEGVRPKVSTNSDVFLISLHVLSSLVVWEAKNDQLVIEVCLDDLGEVSLMLLFHIDF